MSLFAPDDAPKKGATKVVNGVSYRFNENSRWERADKQRSAAAPKQQLKVIANDGPVTVRAAAPADPGFAIPPEPSDELADTMMDRETFEARLRQFRPLTYLDRDHAYQGFRSTVFGAFDDADRGLVDGAFERLDEAHEYIDKIRDDKDRTYAQRLLDNAGAIVGDM